VSLDIFTYLSVTVLLTTSPSLAFACPVEYFVSFRRAMVAALLPPWYQLRQAAADYQRPQDDAARAKHYEEQN
jgi:hypothetical protein